MKIETAGSTQLLSGQKKIIAAWHKVEPEITSWEDACRLIPVKEEGLLGLSASITRINTFQWHEEDKAREVGVSDSVIAAVKRSIDHSNQRRVNMIEKLDLWLEGALTASGKRARAGAPLSSETPGSIVDRISILALKIYHMGEQAKEPGLDAEKRAKFKTRLNVLNDQMKDLSGCFDALWRDLFTGRRRFKTYYQLKMYNDPETNPYMRKRQPR